MRISEEQLLLTIFYEIRYFNASDDILRNTETTIFQEYNSCVVSLQGKRDCSFLRIVIHSDVTLRS